MKALMSLLLVASSFPSTAFSNSQKAFKQAESAFLGADSIELSTLRSLVSSPLQLKSKCIFYRSYTQTFDLVYETQALEAKSLDPVFGDKWVLRFPNDYTFRIGVTVPLEPVGGNETGWDVTRQTVYLNGETIANPYRFLGQVKRMNTGELIFFTRFEDLEKRSIESYCWQVEEQPR